MRSVKSWEELNAVKDVDGPTISLFGKLLLVPKFLMLSYNPISTSKMFCAFTAHSRTASLSFSCFDCLIY